MSTMNLPLEIYDTLERKLGREDAMAIAKSIEKSLGHIEQRSYDVAAQRKLEVREEYRLNVADETMYEFIVLDEPSKSAPYTRWHSSDNWAVIGIKGNYYIVMNDNENVCYIPQKQLWDGNG